MPRNHSVKQTIAMIKSGIKEKQEEKTAEPQIFNIPVIANECEVSCNVELKATEKDEVIRFYRKDEKPNKKWYQFWK